MLKKLAALLLGAIVLALGALFSVVVLGVLAVLGLGVWAWLWWKTRALRAAMNGAARTAPQEASPEGQVIEGEAIVVEENGTAQGAVLPAPRRT